MSHDTTKREIRVGDEVTFTVTGKVIELEDDYGCARVADSEGWHHGVFVNSTGIDLDVERGFEVGKLYQDSDGQIFLRHEDGWQVLGSEQTRPLCHVAAANFRPVDLPYDEAAW